MSTIITKIGSQLFLRLTTRTHLNPVFRKQSATQRIIGVVSNNVIVLSAISRRMYQQHAMIPCIHNRFVHRVLIPIIPFTKTHIDDLSAIVNRITNPICHVLIALIAVRNHANCHNSYVISNTVQTNSIATNRTNDARYVGTMRCIRPRNVVISITNFMRIIVVIAHNIPWLVIQIVLVFHRRFHAMHSLNYRFIQLIITHQTNYGRNSISDFLLARVHF